LSRVTAKYHSEVQISPILGTFFLALNLARPPLRDRVGLRQALSMALDREFISKNVMMGVTPAYSYVAPGILGYSSPSYFPAQK
jgi:oligopeptide transport system substrate-binding protein